MKGIKHWDPYHLLLLTQVIFIFLSPLMATVDGYRAFLTSFGLSFILFAGLNVLRGKRKLHGIGVGLSAAFVGMNLLLEFNDYPRLFVITFALFFLTFAFVVYHIVNMLIKADQIRPSFISGGMAGYLMIGITLAFFLFIMGPFMQLS